MKSVLMALLMLTAAKSFAADIYCHSSASITIQISPENKAVSVFKNRKMADQFTIAETSVSYLKSMPVRTQTTYTLEDGYSISVTLRKNPNTNHEAKQIGDGYAERNGMKAAAYQSCSVLE